MKNPNNNKIIIEMPKIFSIIATVGSQDWDESHRLPERFVPLVIINGDPMKGPSEAPRYHSAVVFKGFQEGPSIELA